ncbi:hypothetical protein KAR91_12180 [Candidatus Pacearchaeota archaeon]|nr:hypothetical protein [Candidatus Pacearchaeota archaeon]
MKRRTFLKGLISGVVALATQKINPSKLAPLTEVPPIIPDPTTSIWVVEWGEEGLEGVAAKTAESLLYGDTSVDPEVFCGLAARYDS